MTPPVEKLCSSVLVLGHRFDGVLRDDPPRARKLPVRRSSETEEATP